ncbi:hypothetical protein TKK_0008549 [Trichogramma kaykai]|uniref:Uncharacterized protein n=1 Tax=Trichogramma kaykai TaxID=54128 RepID=A0ABD2X6P0_9HYME
MADDKFDIYCYNGDVGCQYDFNSEIANYYKIISNLRKLKSMRELVIQDMKEHQDDFPHKVLSLIRDWEGQYPNFRKVLRPREMDWLLTKCEHHQDEIVSFVIKSGYEDELEIDEDGQATVE